MRIEGGLLRGVKFILSGELVIEVIVGAKVSRSRILIECNNWYMFNIDINGVFIV